MSSLPDFVIPVRTGTGGQAGERNCSENPPAGRQACPSLVKNASWLLPFILFINL
jgi:hypothetical protein